MNNQEKLVKVARVGYIVSKVCYLLACVGCVAAAVLAVVLPLTVKNHTIPPMQFCAMFVDLALVMFFAIGILWNAQQWCRAIRDTGSPFTPKLPKYLLKMGITTILASTLPAIIATAIVQSVIRDSELVFNIGISGIICGVILIFGSVFFQYGAKLQQSNDETL